jgi:hypothetical protein
MSEGAVIVGFTTSFITIVCVAVEVLPFASVAVQTTRVVPTGKEAGALLAIVATEQLSKAVAVPMLIPFAEHADVVLAFIFAGARIIGSSISETITFCVAVAVSPLPSVTVHITTVVPTLNAEGALFTSVATEQLSEVNGVPKLTFRAMQLLFVFALTAAGAKIVGF